MTTTSELIVDILAPASLSNTQLNASPPPNDNSLNIATTSYVQESIASPIVVTTITANTTLPNKNQVVQGNCVSGAVTATLPSATGNGGTQLFLTKSDTTANLFGLQCFGTDTIQGVNLLNLAYQYDSRQLVSNGTGTWLIMSSL